MPGTKPEPKWKVEDPTPEDLAPEGTEHDCDGVPDDELVEVLDFEGEVF